MSVDPKFKTVGNYDAESPLDRQITQLESNTGAAFSAIAEQALAKLSPTNRKTADYEAKAGELVVCAGDFSVILPAPAAKTRGEVVAIEMQSGTVTTSARAALVQGEASDELPAPGTFIYVSDGVGWWRPGGVTSVTVGGGLTGGGTGAVEIGLDDTILTSGDLDAAVQPIRWELEKLRVLMIQLVKAELGDELDRGVEGLDA